MAVANLDIGGLIVNIEVSVHEEGAFEFSEVRNGRTEAYLHTSVNLPGVRLRSYLLSKNRRRRLKSGRNPGEIEFEIEFGIELDIEFERTGCCRNVICFSREYLPYPIKEDKSQVQSGVQLCAASDCDFFPCSGFSFLGIVSKSSCAFRRGFSETNSLIL